MSKPKKPNAKQRELQASWDKVVADHQRWPRFHTGPAPRPPQSIAKTTDMADAEMRVVAKYVTHGGTAVPAKVYTGDKVVGIAVMHKSCLQPIFNDQEAVDSAHMRR